MSVLVRFCPPLSAMVLKLIFSDKNQIEVWKIFSESYSLIIEMKEDRVFKLRFVPFNDQSKEYVVQIGQKSFLDLSMKVSLRIFSDVILFINNILFSPQNLGKV
jgi:hypothetical protein